MKNLYSLTFLCVSMAAAPFVYATHSRIQFHDQMLFLNGLNLAWGQYPSREVSFADDIGPTADTPNMTHFNNVFSQLQKNGANCMRFWLHTDGSVTPEWKGSMVISPGKNTIADLTMILDAAWEHDISLMLCLWSFDMLRISSGDKAGISHEIIDRNMAILTKPECRRSYIENSLVPMVNALKDHPAILAWEIFNEPEGMSDEQGWKHTRHVPMAAIQTFINLCAGAIHRTDPDAKVTNGSWAFITSTDIDGYYNYYTDARLIAAGGDPDGTLNFYCVHYYDWGKKALSPFLHPASHWKLDKPIVIAEFFPNCKNCTKTPYETLYQNGYAGVLAWSWTDSSHQTMLEHISAISKAHSQDVRLVTKEASASVKAKSPPLSKKEPAEKQIHR